MTWVRIDDEFFHHPKPSSLGPLRLPAIGLHVLALCWCNKNLTNGKLSELQVGILAGDLETLLPSGRVDELVGALVEARMWRRSKAGYVIHDYLKYQPSRKQVLAERKATAARVQRHRNAKRNAVTPPVSNGDGNGVTTPLVQPPRTRTRRSTIRSVGKEGDQLDQDRAEPTIREPGAHPEPPTDTDVASQSLPPTDRSSPPAVRDGGVHDDTCPCGGSYNNKCRLFAAGSPRRGPAPVSDATRHEIANLFAYPPAGKRMKAMLLGQIEWCAGATEEHWRELLQRATNGKNQPERQPDGSIREGWAKTTMRGILEGAER